MDRRSGRHCTDEYRFKLQLSESILHTPQPPLPNADDKQMLYIRWVVNSNKPTNPKDNPNGIGSGGSSKIRNIRVTGEPISGTTPEQPTIDLSYVPEQGGEKVAVTTPIEVKFNKPITVTAKQEITVRDGQNQPVPGLAVEVINQTTLRIGHGGLGQGKSYRVTIPQTAVQGKDGPSATKYRVELYDCRSRLSAETY